jgi:hypothetical protein
MTINSTAASATTTKIYKRFMKENVLCLKKE